MKGVILAVLLLMGSLAQAAEFAFGVGYRLNDGTALEQSVSVDSKGGMILGLLSYVPFWEQMQLRTGFLYNERKFVIDGGAISEAALNYVDVPLTLMWRPDEKGGIFLGPVLGLKASEECGPGDCDAKAIVTPIQLGGFVKMGPQLAMEVFYETVSGRIYSGIKDSTAVGVSILVVF